MPSRRHLHASCSAWSVGTPLKLPRCFEGVLDGTSVTSSEVGDNHHVLDVAGLTAVISAIRTWLARYGGGRRSVRLEIGGDALELSDATAADQERLIRLFIDRHATEAEER
jgi:hypothetical protein